MDTPAGVACVVGTFDGVHRGHIYLLEQLKQQARQRGLLPEVYTFDCHPLSIVAPGRQPVRLMDNARRNALLARALGGNAGCVHELDFAAIRKLTAREFLAMLAGQGVKMVMIGHDNRFGSDRPSSVAQYRDAAAGTGIEIVEANELTDDALGQVNSSHIRRLIACGDITGANSLLGRHFSLTGTVTHGRQLGRTIGFPTANITVDDLHAALPSPGVYAAVTCIDGVRYPAMLNIGLHPTVDRGGETPTIEAHIIGYDGDLYGITLTLELTTRLRDTRRFDTLDHLKQQLASDREAATQLYVGVSK